MLTQEENEKLTRVGPGTPMGTLFRRYWLPVALSEELPQPDCPPVRVKALGENLVAFRDTEGRVGLLEEHCPHRRASMYLGVNEEGGLRCVYHGWKFDVSGNCVDMPTEPPDHKFKSRIKARSYPVREAGGAIWAYMGPADKMPPFRESEFGWVQRHPGNAHVFKHLEECNFAQAIEGGLDMAHAPILHRRLPFSVPGLPNAEFITEGSPQTTDDLSPRTHVEHTAYGMRLVSEQYKDEDSKEDVVAIIPFIPPSWTVVPPFNAATAERMVNFWMPRDDYSTWHLQWLYSATGDPIDIERRTRVGGHWVDRNYRKLRNRDNDYLLDRAAQKTRNMSGMEGIVTEDHAVNESQGTIMDRTREHLGTIDIAAIAMRRLLLRSAKSVMAGEAPPGLECGAFDKIRSERVEKPHATRWQDASPLIPEHRIESKGR
jgi:phthalate 4,5-dioxygenase oxygenase subunit